MLGAVASAIRLILILTYSPVLNNDSHTYLEFAHQLASINLHGFSGGRTPGYPLLLIALRYSPVAAWCLQALIGVLTTLLVYGLVRRLGGGAGVALLAGLLYALDLEVLALEHMVLTETLASFLLLLAAHVTVSILESEHPRRTTLAGLGVILAYLCLVRPDTLLITAYLVLALWVALSHTYAGHERAAPGLAARRALWILLPPLALAAAWIGFNRATVGVTSMSTVIGYNMIDHVAPYVDAQPGPDYPITSAYVAARTRREAHTSDLTNLSDVAAPAMERAAHLDSAHLSGRLLSVALGVIERRPFQYLASSLKQWPRFWLPPNYAYQFASGSAAGAIRVIWKLERAVLAAINVAFVLLLLTDLARRAWGRASLVRRPSWVLAGVALVGLIPATFLAYGETGRYGYPYFPLVLGVCAATGQIVWRALRIRAPRAHARPRPSRM